MRSLGPVFLAEGVANCSSARHITATRGSSRVVRLGPEDVETGVEPYWLALPLRRYSRGIRSRPWGFSRRLFDPHRSHGERLPSMPLGATPEYDRSSQPLSPLPRPRPSPRGARRRFGSMQRTVPTTARELLPVKHALPPRRTLRSDRSPRGDEQPGAHEPRRKTSPRLTHPRPLPGGPKPADVASPLVTPRDRARRPVQPPTMRRSRRLALQGRSAMLRSCVTPAPPTEAGFARPSTEAQQAVHPYTPDTGSRCPSVVETTSGHESHLAPPRGRFELSRAPQPKLESTHTRV